MANLSGVSLDANVEESTGGFDLIPEGKYHAVIVKDLVKDTKAGDGKILELAVQITAGEYAQKTVTDRINIVNKSAQAQAIGQGQLKRLCRLTGIEYPPADTAGMYGQPLEITIAHEDFTSNRTGKKLTSMKIKNYNKQSGTVPVNAPAAPAAASQPAAGSAGSSEW